MLFHVLDPAEIDFTFDDAASFEDLESGEQLPVIPDALREQYRAMVQRAHRGAHEQGQRATRGLQPAEYRGAARLRALQLHVDPRSTEPDPLMSFLAPLFFAGLAALAVPVLIHLIQRERKNVVRVSVADVRAADSRTRRFAGAAFTTGRCCAAAGRRSR